jgi:hypothetical protein
MDIILSGSRTPPKVSGPTAAKPLAGRETGAGGGCLPPPSPLPAARRIRVDLQTNASRRGTGPRLCRTWTRCLRSRWPQHPKEHATRNIETGGCPEPGPHRIEATPAESTGAVKGREAGACSARTLDGPEHSATIRHAGQPQHPCSASDRPAPSILGECSAPSRLPSLRSAADAGLDGPSALPGVGPCAELGWAWRSRRASPPARGERATARGLGARGAGLHRADKRVHLDQYGCLVHSGGGTAGRGSRPPRPGAGLHRADKRVHRDRHGCLVCSGGGDAGGGSRPPRACTT